MNKYNQKEILMSLTSKFHKKYQLNRKKIFKKMVNRCNEKKKLIINKNSLNNVLEN